MERAGRVMKQGILGSGVSGFPGPSLEHSKKDGEGLGREVREGRRGMWDGVRLSRLYPVKLGTENHGGCLDFEMCREVRTENWELMTEDSPNLEP